MSALRILVASSNAKQRAELRAGLASPGCEVADVGTGAEGVERASAEYYDVLVIDSELERSGSQGLRQEIRSHSNLGIIVWGDILGTTASDSLNAGADDFIQAPFVMAEMLVRVRAILRRVSRSNDDHPIVLQDREVDLKSYEIKGPGCQIARLTPKEFLVLQYLLAHADEPRTTQALAQTISQRDGKGELEYVQIVIRQLRKKLEPDPGKPRYIISERPEDTGLRHRRFTRRVTALDGVLGGAKQWARLA